MVRVGLAVLALAVGPALAGDATVGEVRAFRDWAIGCDNANGCTALGLEADQAGGAYLALRRDAGPDAAPTIAVMVMTSGKLGKPSLRVLVPGSGGFGPKLYPVEANGDYLQASIPPEDVAALAAALLKGTELRLTIVDPGHDHAAEVVSLRGAAAALLYLDDRQQRIGGVTALARPGDAPASTVPAPPPLPAVPRQTMTELDPVPALPAGLKASSEPSCDGVDPVAFDLGGGTQLWGLCEIAGAYNTSYRLWLIDASGARPASFRLPGRAADDPAVLTEPSLNPDGLGLDALDLGRGVGDCGDQADWGWDGKGFELLQYRELQTCAGVLPEDWPLLWQTRTP